MDELKSVDYYAGINKKIKEKVHATLEADSRISEKDRERLMSIYDADYKEIERWNDGYKKGYIAGYKKAAADLARLAADIEGN